MSLVLDSSAALAWIFTTERTEPITQLLNQVITAGAWVPSLWRLEIANVLQMAVRRGRIERAFRDATLADLEPLPIQIDPETSKFAWHTTVRLAERHRLTVYDAAYLELALRRGLPLASLDRDLREAALKENIALLGG